MEMKNSLKKEFLIGASYGFAVFFSTLVVAYGALEVVMWLKY
jgi:hypothetical protein